MVVERVACGGHADQFPVGMRVLAVDDDPTCLRLLETLLRRCQYNVTTTNQAITALHLLRDSKNKFDLVISDVHMPDMDGFKLLELVGLEMDLPVIMLSANGDSKLVMKGITHGACDYLLKPIRIEELKNIWQHVVRRRKVDVKDHNNSDGHEKAQFGNCEIAESGNADQGGKLNKKRKDNEDLCEEHDEGNENEDPSTQKKPRVVWTPQLHAKFVASVGQLGMDKAVPKKILEVMNVEKLTRENVASHLQKYRLYLKKAANQGAHMPPLPFSGTDSMYLRMGYMNGYGNLPSLAGSNPLPSRAYMPFSSSSEFGRLNTPGRVGLHSLPSSGMSHTTNLEDPSDVGIGHNNFRPVVNSGDFKGGILQGMPPMSLAANELHRKGVTSSVGLPTIVDVPPVCSSFIGTRSVTNNSVPGVPMVLEGHVQEANCAKSSDMVDFGRCGDNYWSSTIPSSDLQFPLLNDQCLRQAASSCGCPNDLMESLSAMACNTSSGQILVNNGTHQELDAPPYGSSNLLFNGGMVPLGRDMEQGDMFCYRDTDLDSNDTSESFAYQF